MDYSLLLKQTRVRILLICLVLGSIPFFTKGLEFGLDFKGGTLIQLRLEKEVQAETMGLVTNNLQERLNGLGLKDIKIRPWGSQFVLIEVSETNVEKIEEMENLLKKQGRFEAIIDGLEAIGPEDIMSVITDPQKGYGIERGEGFGWQVPFALTPSGSLKFSQAAFGRCEAGECSKIYMFIDRPLNAIIMVPKKVWGSEGDGEELMYMSLGAQEIIDISELEKNSKSEFVLMESDEPSETDMALLSNLSSNYSKVILHDSTSNATRDKIEAMGFVVEKIPKGDRPYWVWSAVNLKSIAFLTAGLTDGEPHANLVFSGGSSSRDEAERELRTSAILLSSGRLPVSATVESSTTIAPTLGQEFLTYSVAAGLIALLAVGIVIFYRYRDLGIAIPIMSTSLCELFLTLCFASFIGMNIDLAAIAGLVAAVGTGVDDQLVITDEVMRGEKKEKLSYGLLTRIKSAFFVIFVAAATIIAAMFPLLTLGMGMLRGFSIATISAVLVGVLITRPAYATYIENFVR